MVWYKYPWRNENTNTIQISVSARQVPNFMSIRLMGAILGEEALEVVLAGDVVEVAAGDRPHGIRISAASSAAEL